LGDNLWGQIPNLDLGTGDTLVIFHSSGKTPRLIDILNSFVTAEVILRAVSFSILVEISSWPLDLVVSRVESISNTSSSVHINGSGSPFGSVDGKSVDSNTGVEWLNELIKTLFSRLPFSRSEMATIFGASRVEVLGGSQF